MREEFIQICTSRRKHLQSLLPPNCRQNVQSNKQSSYELSVTSWTYNLLGYNNYTKVKTVVHSIRMPTHTFPHCASSKTSIRAKNLCVHFTKSSTGSLFTLPHRSVVWSQIYLMLMWKELFLLTSKPPDQVQLGTSISLTHNS